MKKILILICCLFIYKVYAIEDIRIDGFNIIPNFNSEIKVYNYFTNKDSVNIKVTPSKDEIILGDRTVNLENDQTRVIINSNLFGDYEINIFKNYNKDNKKYPYITNLTIENYDINFNPEVLEYEITINDEDKLNIDYELENDDAYVVISGNGNFNKSDNLITIKVNNELEYKIHAYKTITVSKEIKQDVVKEMSKTKKEITSLIIIVISCALVFGFYYVLFIDKTIFYI